MVSSPTTDSLRQFKTVKAQGSVDELLIAGILALFASIPLLVTLTLIGLFFVETISFLERVTAVEQFNPSNETFEFVNSQGIWAGVVKFFSDTVWTVGQVELGEEGFGAGVLALLVSTLVISGIAIAIAVPLGILAAIYLAEYAPKWLRTLLKPALESLSGIPTVILGYFGLITLTPLLQNIFPEIASQNGLSAGIVIGVFLIPTISSLAEESIIAVPEELRQSGYALGMTKLEIIWRIIIPAALPGIMAAIALASSRAFGETMIADLAGGRGGRELMLNPLVSNTTMTTFIISAPEGGIEPGSFLRSAAFTVGMLLFLMTLVLNTFGNWLIRRNQAWLSSALVAKADVIATKAKVSEEQLQKIHHAEADVVQSKAVFSPNLGFRNILEKLFYGVALLSTLVAIFVLGVIFYQNVTTGWNVLDWQFLTSFQSTNPEEAGILVPLICTLLITALTAAIVIPLGVGAAIFLEEYLSDTWWRRLIDVHIANLSAVPTIIYGLLGFGLFVTLQQRIAEDPKVGKNILSAALTLVLIVLPLQMIATRNALRNVPNSLRYAGYALGMTRWQVIWRVVLPTAFPAIASGSMLAITTAIAETAALIAVGAVVSMPFIPKGITDSFITLPIQSYYWNAAGEAFQPLNSGAIVVLIAILLFINLAAVVIRNLFGRKLR
jgi:phosphate transport system permease protein